MKHGRVLFFLIFMFTFLGAHVLCAQTWPHTKEMGVFLCHASFSLKEMENHLAVLDDLQTEVREKLKLDVPKEKIEVYFFSDEASWRAYHARAFPSISYRRALFVKPDVIIQTKRSRGRVYVYVSDRLTSDLRHEGTHALLHAMLGKPLPIWLDEGLAEYFEADPQWAEPTQQRITSGKMIPLKQLEKITGMRGMTRDAYGDSWAWVTFLLDGPEDVRRILPEYLNDFSKKLFFSSISSRLGKLHRRPDALLRTFFLDRTSEN
ncbi:MAG: hypothetical protein Q4C96_05290 [Planctomycetia bacterium]|nr:hypothetical protein [Planctomycetia bacterium]